MEGGKIMRARLTFKIMFVFILSLLLTGLLFIIFDKAGTRARFYDPSLVADYVLVNKNETCVKTNELLYEDESYSYYLPCTSSYDVYLEWTDGDKDLVKNALNSGKVTIGSLIDHGLEVEKHEK